MKSTIWANVRLPRLEKVGRGGIACRTTSGGKDHIDPKGGSCFGGKLNYDYREFGGKGGNRENLCPREWDHPAGRVGNWGKRHLEQASTYRRSAGSDGSARLAGVLKISCVAAGSRSHSRIDQKSRIRPDDRDKKAFFSPRGRKISLKT